MYVYKALLKSFQSSFMLMIPLSIILQSCWGSIAALFTLMKKDEFMIWKLAVCIAATMIYNASILARLKPTIVFNLLILSLGANTFLILLTWIF